MTSYTEQEQARIARIKLIPFATSTMTDTEFLTGAAHGRDTNIAGEFRLPVSSHAKLPAVVLVHGSNGLGAREAAWAEILNAQGIATFTLDCFTGRGIVTTASDQAQMGRLTMIVDIYRAVALLSEQSEIDAARIAVMGFSRGGQAALYCSVDRFRKMHAPEDVNIAAFISFYPDCSTRYVDDGKVDAKPIRVHHGSADDYNPLQPCEVYIERLRANGADATLTQYPDAHHVFDTPNPDGPRFSPAAQTVRNCALSENPDGRIINAATGEPFTYSDACVLRGTTAGQHPQARQEAIRNVTAFLAGLFN